MHRSSHVICAVRLGLCLLVLGAPALASADGSDFATELVGPRGLAMGDAVRASGTSNDVVFLNPAALFATERYTFSAQGLHDFAGNAESFGLAITDSTAGPVAAGVAADRLFLGQGSARITGNVFHLALATQISDFISVGATGEMLHTDEGGTLHNRVTADVGVLVKADPLTLSFSAYHLVDVYSPLAPRQYALGLGMALPHELHVEGDAVLDSSTRADTALKFEGGAEWSPLPILLIRGGYVEDRILDQRAITGGLGLTVPPGFGIDVGYRHELLGVMPARVVMLGANFAI